MKDEDAFVKIVTNRGPLTCEDCAFNDGESIKCHRPDHFNVCWDEETDYIFKEKAK